MSERRNSKFVARTPAPALSLPAGCGRTIFAMAEMTEWNFLIERFRSRVVERQAPYQARALGQFQQRHDESCRLAARSVRHCSRPESQHLTEDLDLARLVPEYISMRPWTIWQVGIMAANTAMLAGIAVHRGRRLPIGKRIAQIEAWCLTMQEHARREWLLRKRALIDQLPVRQLDAESCDIQIINLLTEKPLFVVSPKAGRDGIHAADGPKSGAGVS